MTELSDWVKGMSPDTLALNGLGDTAVPSTIPQPKRNQPRHNGRSTGSGNGRITFIVPMKAYGKARPRLGRHGTHMPADYVRWCKEFAAAVPDEVVNLPADQLVILRVIVVRKMPKRWGKAKKAEMHGTWTTAGPDTDNAVGSIMDAVWKSDKKKAAYLAMYDEAQPRKTDDVVISQQCSSVWGYEHALIVTVELTDETVRPFDLSVYGV